MDLDLDTGCSRWALRIRVVWTPGEPWNNDDTSTQVVPRVGILACLLAEEDYGLEPGARSKYGTSRRMRFAAPR